MKHLPPANSLGGCRFVRQPLCATPVSRPVQSIVGTDLHDARISARNLFCGTVAKLVPGAVNAEVDIEIGGGNMISAIITRESAARLGLTEGGHACALFKASSVIIGVD